MALRSTRLATVVSLLAVAGCLNPTDDSENRFPDLGALADAGAGGDDGGADPGGYPAAFRVTCIKIRNLGSATAEDFQAQLLSHQWQQDIVDFKLNILFVVRALDRAAGTSSLQVNSGEGTGDADLCTAPASTSDVFQGPAADGEVPFPVSGAVHGGLDTAPDGTTAEGSVALDVGLTPADLIYIHSQDDDGTAFNCTPDEALPDAVPLRAVQGRFGVSPDAATATGTINGCLTFAEGSQLCSCLGACQGDGPDDVQTEGQCAGCPKGGIPLTDMLIGITSTEHCTGVMGETAFDLGVEIVASRLAGVPAVCE